MTPNPRSSPRLAVAPVSVPTPALFAILLLAALPALAASTTTAFVPAVNPDGRGVLTTISCTVAEGNGVPPGVYFDVEPFINVDTQQSGKTAAKIAAEEAGVSLANKALLYKIRSDASSVDGPSGGNAFALLCFGELARKRVRADHVLAVTGTIEIDATVGTVGGVAEKLEAAARRGVTLFLLPARQSEVDGVDYAALADELSNGRLRVVAVADLHEAASVAYAAPGTPLPVFERPEVRFQAAFLTPFLSNDARAFEGVARVTLEKARAAVDALERRAAESGAGGNATPPLVSNFTFANLRRQLNESQAALALGYGYTAANTAFLAKIRAETLGLALDNVTAEDLQTRVLDLQAEMLAFEFAALNDANWQYVAGAQLRYHWALLTLEDANASLAAGAPAGAHYADYRTAANWFDAVREMNALAATQCPGCPAFDGARAKALAREALARMNGTSVDDPETVIHARGAERAFETGHFTAAVLDASFVFAFARAEQELHGKTARDVYALLSNESALKALADSTWAQLYYSHAWHSQQHANQTRNAQSLVNAHKLDRLAIELHNQTLAVRAALRADAPAARPAAPFSPANGTAGPVVSVEVRTPDDGTRWVLAAVVFAVVLLCVAVALRARGANRKPASPRLKPRPRSPRARP